MTAFTAKAVQRLPPRPFGFASPQASQAQVPLTAASSVEITIPGSGVDGRYITLRPTVNCHIAFHIAGMSPAATSDMLFFGGATEEYIVPMEVTSMRMIKATGAADGFLAWCLSSPT
jgi:hypothetical protein